MKWIAPVLVGLVGVGFFLGFDRENAPEPKAETVSMAAKAPVVLPHSRTVDGSISQPPEEQSRLDGFSEKSELSDAVRAVDLWSPSALNELSDRMRASDAEMIQVFFVEELEASAGKLPERDRIIAIAEHFQGDGLLPFWRNVIERTPPRTVPELRKGEHPDVMVAQELYKAVRALRILAAVQPEARDYLSRLALDASLHKDDVLLRSQAYFAVKEVDITASLRILRALDTSDPLSVELSRQ